MYLKISYENEFDDLMMYLRSKYPNKLFDLDGIGEQVDMSKFSKKFFSANTTADASIDANANVDDVSVIAYTTELPKPFFKLNSYYILWKELRRLYGHLVANEIIEKQLTGDIYIHDFHGIAAGQPYSYYEKTIIVVNDNGNIIYSTMKELFEHFSQKFSIESLPDREVINLNNVTILDNNNQWSELKYILRHKSHTNLVKLETKNGFTTIVTTDHPVILEDGSEKYAKDLSLNDKLKLSNAVLPLTESKQISEDYAYMTGFMIGDGWLQKRKGTKVDIRSGNLSICQNNIKESKIDTIVNKLYDNVSYNKKGNKIYFGYKKDVENLLSTGLGSINRKLPNDILSWNKTAIKALLSGIIDSDGNINNQNGMITIRVISYELVQQIGELLRALNIGKVRVSFAGKYKSKLGFSSDNDVFRVSIRLTDKSFIQYSEKVSNNNELVFKAIGIDGRFETNQLYKIEDWETPEYVYDITTSTGHFHCQGLIQHNCYNYSTYDIMTQGLPMVKKIKSKPPKYLYAFKSQLEQFTVIASNSTLGATGLADMLIIMSYYVQQIINTGADAHFEMISLDLALSFTDEQKTIYSNHIVKIKESLISTFNNKQKDIYAQYGFFSKQLFDSFNKKQHDLYYQGRAKMVKGLKETFSTEQNEIYLINIFKYVRENLVSFIYTINQPMRGNQSPFTNISIYDRYFLEKLCGDYIFPDGSTPDIKLVEKLQDLFLTIMNTEMERTPVTFPITTACFSIDENNKLKDKVFLKFIAKHNKKYGFINLYGGDSSTLSSCCRLRSETKSEYFNSFGSGSSKIGSLGVCSINFPRLAISAEKNETTFFEELKKLIEICAKVNHAKRHIVKKRIDNGNQPLYTMGFCDLNTQYSTVGVNGLNECIEFMGKDILTEEGQKFTLDIIHTINTINKKFEKQYNAPHNCEQVPGENMSIKMAEKDKLLGYQNVHNIYSNQFIPLVTNADMLDRIMLQAKFDKHFSGGAICHINVDTPIEDETQLEELIKTVIEMGVVYFAINYNLQECENGHMSVGKNNNCSICAGEITNNYTRVVGFLTNTRNWHKIRRNEDYPNRQWYHGKVTL